MSVLSSVTQNFSQIPGCVSCGVLSLILLISFSTPFDSTPEIFDTQIFIEVNYEALCSPGICPLRSSGRLVDRHSDRLVVTRVKSSRLWLESYDFNQTLR